MKLKKLILVGGIIMVILSGCVSPQSARIDNDMRFFYEKLNEKPLQMGALEGVESYTKVLSINDTSTNPGKTIEYILLRISKNREGIIQYSTEDTEEKKYSVKENNDGNYIYEEGMPEKNKELEEVFNNLKFDDKFFKSLKI